jgi:DNA-binding transcriptional MocR family regulator
LPTVRELAAELAISPATVASAYKTLRQRGLVAAGGRRGTVVAPQPPLRVRRAQPLPPDVRDLASGNPDPELLPQLAPVFAKLDPTHKLYGGAVKLPELVAIAEQELGTASVAVLGGALDGIERALQTQLLPGDRVVVEDPSWPRINDLLVALGFVPEPVPVDRDGLVPERLDAALRAGARAAIVTPRGQNPTGAALSTARGRALRDVLRGHPDVLVIEDDYCWAVAGAPYVPVHGTTERWLMLRSLSKVLGPDLRVALAAGDELTVSRIEGRQLLGPGWVSHILQQCAARLLGSAQTRRLLARAERVYAERRAALLAALAEVGIEAQGDSGLGVWIPLDDESATAQLLLERGWAVAPGERYRFRSEPGVRVTTTALRPTEARELAAAFVEAGDATYAG